MKISDILEFAPMAQTEKMAAQDRASDTPVVGILGTYKPEAVARIKAAAAQPSIGPMNGDQAIEHFRRLLSNAGHAD